MNKSNYAYPEGQSYFSDRLGASGAMPSRVSVYEFINQKEGCYKFDGDEYQYCNMLYMFDRLTLTESIVKVFEHLKRENISDAINELHMLTESSR